MTAYIFIVYIEFMLVIYIELEVFRLKKFIIESDYWLVKSTMYRFRINWRRLPKNSKGQCEMQGKKTVKANNVKTCVFFFF